MRTRPGCATGCAVTEAEFGDATLVLVGHGSSVTDRAAATTEQHAEALRRRGLFGQVLTAFWKTEPDLATVVESVTARRLFVVPLFLSEGFFSEEAIPRALGLKGDGAGDFVRVRASGRQTLYYARALGEHPRLTEVILARAREVVERRPFPRAPEPVETALVVAGHGTSRNERSRAAVEQHVAALRRQALYAEVLGVFLEEEPGVEKCYELARTRNLVVVPFFMSEGPHTMVDLPVQLGETPAVVQARWEAGRATWRNPTERQGRRVWLAECVGTAPLLAELILERVREVAAAAASDSS